MRVKLALLTNLRVFHATDPTISVAWLIRLIGRAGGTDYGASGSSTKRYKAVNLMEQWYRNVYREDVSETYVRRMIFERRLPAIIMGRNANGLTEWKTKEGKTLKEIEKEDIKNG